MATIKEAVDISKEFNIPANKITEVFKLLDAVSICTLDGTIVHGQKIGGKLGFPTANLNLYTSKDCLKNGVYGVKVNLRGLTYYGVMNAGVKPTLNTNIQKTYEIHLFDFNQSIYGEEINVEVKFFIREEIKFSSINQLIQQIENDIMHVKYKFELQQMGKIGL
ncbi:riboflavin kinase [Neobacillus cucumis]|uniref:riboflavin kinase n=1 Tax=Neobacillus cucumis TaxID=1740721 RepID=A0A2N5HCA4_9BACI|nr:riboflavin kinase [Neobacillus cucumis]PLS03144.1 riboflavin kinase [Neobacillus cucumis]